MFRQKSPGILVVLFFFGLVLKLPLFLWPRPTAATKNDEDFFRWLIHWFDSGANTNALASSLLAFALLYIQAVMVNYLVNEHRLMPKPTYLPAMAYLLLTSLLPEWTYLSSPLAASTLVLWAFAKLLRVYNADRAGGIIFNVGLLLGLSSYLYFPSASFLLCVLLGIAILKPFRLNEIVLLALGCLTPYYFVAAIQFLQDKFDLQSFFPHIALRTPVVKSNLSLAASLVLLAIPFLTGGFFVQKHMHKMLIQVRKAWSILLFYLLLAFFIPFVNSNSSFSNWVLLAVPFACFHASTYFYAAKKWVPNVILLLTAGCVFYLQYATTAWR